jgi:hypothetical protein
VQNHLAAIAFVSKFFFQPKNNCDYEIPTFLNMSHTCRHFLSILIVRKKIQSNDGGGAARAVMATG